MNLPCQIYRYPDIYLLRIKSRLCKIRPNSVSEVCYQQIADFPGKLFYGHKTYVNVLYTTAEVEWCNYFMCVIFFRFFFVF